MACSRKWRITEDGESRKQWANSGSPGKWPLKQCEYSLLKDAMPQKWRARRPTAGASERD